MNNEWVHKKFRGINGTDFRNIRYQ